MTSAGERDRYTAQDQAVSVPVDPADRIRGSLGQFGARQLAVAVARRELHDDGGEMLVVVAVSVHRRGRIRTRLFSTSDFSGAVGAVIVVASTICLLGVIYPFRPFRTRRRALKGVGLCVLGFIAFAVLLAPPPAGEPATRPVGPAEQDLPEDAQLAEPTGLRSSSERFFTATDNLPESARNLVAWVGTVPADVATLGILGTFILMITLSGLWLQEMGAQRRANSEVAALRARFAPVLDLDAAVAERLTEKTRLDDAIAQTRAEYAEKRRLFDTLKHQLAVYDVQKFTFDLTFG